MNSQPVNLSFRLIAQLVLFVIVIPLLPLLISGQWRWWEAWVYALLYILSFAVSRALAARRHPDIIAERSRFMQQENTKDWDKKLAPLAALSSGMILVIAGLDALLSWSPAFSMPVKIVALVIILAGYALSSYALIKNRFFSGTVRIQSERGHHVVSGGPYRWMRHPGYAGGLLVYLATPFFLDSAWALMPGTLTTLLIMLRTSLEDKTLQEELTGYREYAGRVRYRLLPKVW